MEQEQTEINERLNLLMAVKGENTTSLAKKLGMNQMTVYNYVTGRDPSYSFLCNLLRLYKNLSASWLMLGEGEMELTRTSPTNEVVIDVMNGGNAVAGGNIHVAADYEESMKKKDERIAELESDKRQLTLLVEMLTRK